MQDFVLFCHLFIYLSKRVGVILNALEQLERQSLRTIGRRKANFAEVRGQTESEGAEELHGRNPGLTSSLWSVPEQAKASVRRQPYVYRERLEPRHWGSSPWQSL